MAYDISLPLPCRPGIWRPKFLSITTYFKTRYAIHVNWPIVPRRASSASAHRHTPLSSVHLYFIVCLFHLLFFYSSVLCFFSTSNTPSPKSVARDSSHPPAIYTTSRFFTPTSLNKGLLSCHSRRISLHCPVRSLEPSRAPCNVYNQPNCSPVSTGYRYTSLVLLAIICGWLCFSLPFIQYSVKSPPATHCCLECF